MGIRACIHGDRFIVVSYNNIVFSFIISTIFFSINQNIKSCSLWKQFFFQFLQFFKRQPTSVRYFDLIHSFTFKWHDLTRLSIANIRLIIYQQCYSNLKFVQKKIIWFLLKLFYVFIDVVFKTVKNSKIYFFHVFYRFPLFKGHTVISSNMINNKLMLHEVSKKKKYLLNSKKIPQLI